MREWSEVPIDVDASLWEPQQMRQGNRKEHRHSDFHHHEFRATPKISYTFHELKTLDSAITHIASIRNMFAFFADGYIEISCVEYSSDPLKLPESYGDKVTVILNQIEQIEEIDEPFLINRDCLDKNFQSIVDNWLTFKWV